MVEDILQFSDVKKIWQCPILDQIIPNSWGKLIFHHFSHSTSLEKMDESFFNHFSHTDQVKCLIWFNIMNIDIVDFFYTPQLNSEWMLFSVISSSINCTLWNPPNKWNYARTISTPESYSEYWDWCEGSFWFLLRKSLKLSCLSYFRKC